MDNTKQENQIESSQILHFPPAFGASSELEGAPSETCYIMFTLRLAAEENINGKAPGWPRWLLLTHARPWQGQVPAVMKPNNSHSARLISPHFQVPLM